MSAFDQVMLVSLIAVLAVVSYLRGRSAGKKLAAKELKGEARDKRMELVRQQSVFRADCARAASDAIAAVKFRHEEEKK